MLEEAKDIFMVGIGGIGLSGLARILRSQRKTVAGSDIEESEITKQLEDEGIMVSIGHSSGNLSNGIDLIVYSRAVSATNPERMRARELGIAELSYPEALGELARGFDKVIAVTGTNGKTTTTAMIGTILEDAGEDPTVLVGSRVLAWNSNVRVGRGKYLVLEADEYRRAFLNYPSDVAVITNIEPDHLDYYRDLDDVKDGFAGFVKNIKPIGVLIYNADNKNAAEVAEKFEGGRVSFKAGNLSFKLLAPGKFNQENAAAAAAACKTLGVSKDKIASALENFTGIWRRFEKVGRVQGTDVISDYAHHPAGIKAVLDAAVEVYKDSKKILVVFQPHQHNRTKKLFKEFINAFCSSKVDNLIIAEIFDVAGREETADQDISSGDLVLEIEKCRKLVTYAKDLDSCEKEIKEVISDYSAVIIMGAGDIYKVANHLVE